MSHLCDTNVISELTRPMPNPGVTTWSGTMTSINLSVITIEEIYYGLTAKPYTKVENWFENFLTTHCQILPITSDQKLPSVQVN